MFEGISWLGVVAAVIASFVLGWIWYTYLFRDAWMRGIGLDPTRTPPGDPGLALLIQLVATVVTAVVLAIVIERFGSGPLNGLVVGLLVSAGFVATAKLADLVFSRRLSTGVYYIETANQLASYALMGLVYGLFA